MKDTISISMCSPRLFKSHKPYSGIYPLNTTYKNIYNFNNILESIDNWSAYSSSINKSFSKILELFSIVNDKGTEEQKSLVLKRIEESFKYIQDLKAVIPIIENSNIDNDSSNVLLEDIKKYIQCDRIINNHNLISKRFNIDKSIKEMAFINRDTPEDIISELCSFIDTYNYNIDTKYVLSLEEVLFSLWKNKINILPNVIFESITDYYILNHMNTKDTNGELVSILRNNAYANKFYNESDMNYINELSDIINEVSVYIKKSKKGKEVYISDDGELFVNDLDESTRELIQIMKLRPGENKMFYEKLLNRLLVEYRDKDIIRGTHNLLAFAYNVLLFSSFVSSGANPFLTAIVLMTLSTVTEKVYLDRVLQEWYTYRNYVAYKIKSTKDPKTKKKLENYLKNVDNDIERLEDFHDKLARKEFGMNYAREKRPSDYTGESSLLNTDNTEDYFLAIVNNSVIEESFDIGSKAKKLINTFKLLPVKTKEAFEALINSLLLLYTDENIVNESTNVLSLCFYFLCGVGAMAITAPIGGAAPLIAGILAFVAGKFIYYTKERSYMTGVLKKWYAHRDSTAKKLEKCKNEEKKKKMEDYLKELDKNIAKLEEYNDSLKDDNEDKSDKMRPKNYSGKSKEDDLDFSFDMEDESYIETLSNMKYICESMQNIKWDKDKIESFIFRSDITPIIEPKSIDYMVEFCVKYPSMMDKDKFILALEFAKDYISKHSNHFNYESINKLNCYTENIDRLKQIPNVIMIDESENVMQWLDEVNEYTSNIRLFVDSIDEASIATNVTLVLDKLKRGASDLSAKEQITSNTVDAFTRRMSSGIEKAFRTENREAVIRGDILPPFSKILKLVIATAAIGYFISPVLSLIVVIGRFAMDKRLRTKERQIVANELDVELHVIDRYIRDAEDDKDYKKLRNLMLIKKKLQAQNERLHYNIKYEWDDTNVKVDKKDDEDED